MRALRRGASAASARTPQRRSPEPDETYKPGDPVEVVSDEPHVRRAHYEAVVVARSTRPRGYTVEYDDLVQPGGSARPLREVVPARSLRPRAPLRWSPTEAPLEHAPVDAHLDNAWWLGVDLGDADEPGKVRVCFPDIREVMEFDAADVRPHLEWQSGGWHRRSARDMAKPENMPYKKGMQIEVSKLEDNSVVAWLPAVVVKTFWRSNLLVKYTVSKSDGTASPEEIVDVKHVRPISQQALAISFCINDEVEAFQGDGWWLGVITDVHPGLKYTFKSAHLGMKIQLSQKSLRLRYDWVDGLWKQKSQNTTPKAASIKKRKSRVDGPPDPVPSLLKNHKSPKLGPSEGNKHSESSSNEIHQDHLEKCLLRDTPCPDDQEVHNTVQYMKGMQIEVSLLSGNSVAAWAPAIVAKVIWKNNLLVDYTSLKNMPKVIVDMKEVRPCPPQVSAISFCINDEVEAFHRGCWCPGVITDVHAGLKYTFKSPNIHGEIQLSQKSLRLRHDWVDGLWKQNLQSATPESSPRPHEAASVVNGLPDPAPSLMKKRKFPKVRPSEENKRCESSSKEIYPDHLEKRPLRDAPRPDGQATPTPQPEPTPAPAQRRNGVLKLSLPMNQPAVAPDATVLPSTRESDSEKNEALQNTVTTPVPEAETCSKSPAKSLLTPLDVIIKELKGCREQWLKAQSQLDHSATKTTELEGQVAKLQAASEANAQHLREVMDKQASLEQRLELKDKEIENLKKLVDLDEQNCRSPALKPSYPEVL